MTEPKTTPAPSSPSTGPDAGATTPPVDVEAREKRARGVLSGHPDKDVPHDLALIWLASKTELLAKDSLSLCEEIKRLRASSAVDGWLYHNPDTGIEWSENHPVESGEVHDATDVRPGTATNLVNELIPAWEALRASSVSPAVDDGVLRETLAELLAGLNDLGFCSGPRGRIAKPMLKAEKALAEEQS